MSIRRTKTIDIVPFTISFEEAMSKLSVAPASEVDALMNKDKPKKKATKKKDEKLLAAPKTQRLLPKSKK